MIYGHIILCVLFFKRGKVSFFGVMTIKGIQFPLKRVVKMKNFSDLNSKGLLTITFCKIPTEKGLFEEKFLKMTLGEAHQW